MEENVVCGFCGGNEWIENKEYLFVRKCANPICNGLHPADISKLRDIKGQVYDSNNGEMTDIEELEKRVK